MAKLQQFYLLRTKDISGVSGCGIIAQGVIFSSNRCVVEWKMPFMTITIFSNIEELKMIHSHGGATKVIMGTPSKKLIEKYAPKT